MEKLISMLQWAGIHPDEGPGFAGHHGPYIQSQRVQLYQDSVKTLLEVCNMAVYIQHDKRYKFLFILGSKKENSYIATDTQ